MTRGSSRGGAVEVAKLIRDTLRGAFESPFARRFRTFLTVTLGLTLSPVFAAICDAADGEPVELDHDACMSTFGCAADALPIGVRRRVVITRCGQRAGKSSRLLAGKAIHAAFTVELKTLAPGEHAWALVLAPRRDLANQTLTFIRGLIASTPELRKHVVNGARGPDGRREVGTAEVITIRRPHDGKLVDIRAGVASAGGTLARGKTLVWCGFDEAEFFSSEAEHKFNDRDLFQAAIGRVVPDGQLWMGSTPWIEGYGVMEEIIAQDWARHEEAVIAFAPTRAMNPTWDPDYTIERHMRRTDPDNAAREIDAIPLAAGSKVFFPPALLDSIVNRERKGDAMHLEWIPTANHYGGVDLAFVKNSSALAIARAEAVDEKVKIRIVYHCEERPARGQPLRPSVVCGKFARKCGEYRALQVKGDEHYKETAREEFAKVKVWDELKGEQRTIGYSLFYPSQDELFAACSKIKQHMSEGRFELPFDERLIGQFRRITAKPTPEGGIKIVMATLGAAHSDVAMATIIAGSQVDVRQHRTETGVRGKRSMAAPSALAGERRAKKGKRPDLVAMARGGF